MMNENLIDNKKRKTAKIVFYSTFLLGLLTTLLSIGLILFMYWFVLLPVYIFHFIIGLLSLKRAERIFPLIIASSLAFLLFALLRPDGGFMSDLYWIGFDALLNRLGIIDFYFNSTPSIRAILNTLASLSFFGMILLDFILLFNLFDGRNRTNKTKPT